MTESVYKIVEIAGTSPESWEKAAEAAVAKATKTLRDIRIAEIKELDMQLENGKVIVYRARVNLSLRVETLNERQFYTDPAMWLIEKEHPGLDG
jgi:dodecin